MTGPQKVTLEGKGAVTLRPNDHIATGGEGSIYRVGDIAVKIYLDPAKMRSAGMPEKVKALAQLAHPFVVGPRGMVLNATAEPVGHYLPFVDAGHALSLVFTNEFWAKEGFNPARAAELVAGMRETVEFAHQHGAQLVDANELNWFALLNTTKAEPRVIDVDSWAIGKWPATVIMPSIRDWNSSTFDDASDWFAWAVVTFQIFTGLHPYKGTLPGFDRGDLIGRMKARASVFQPAIKLNRAVRDFSAIPGALRKWYEAVFEQQERSAPPSPHDLSVSAAPAARTGRAVSVAGGGLLVMDLIYRNPKDSITRVFHCGIARTYTGTLIDLSANLSLGVVAAKDAEVVRVELGWLVGDKSGFRYVSENMSEVVVLNLALAFRRLLSFQNRMFAVTDRGLTEITVRMFGGKPIAAIVQTWGIMVNSTRWFDGLGVMDALGATFLVLPFGKDFVAQVRVPELDGIRIVAGRAGTRFVSLILIDKQGLYEKFDLTLDANYALPPKIWRGPAESPELNLAILPKGVCATIVKDGELDIFVPTSGSLRRVEDKQIDTDMALANWGDTVLFLQNGAVWSMKLK